MPNPWLLVVVLAGFLAAIPGAWAWDKYVGDGALVIWTLGCFVAAAGCLAIVVIGLTS